MSEKEEAQTDGADTSDEETKNGKGKKRTADKNKKTTKKGKNQPPEENGSTSTEDENKVSKGDKAGEKKNVGRKKGKVEDTNDSGKIPLLDQPTIVEGTRNRKPVIVPPVKIEVTKSTVEIPHGNGTPLGRIPLVNTRLKRLCLYEVKDLHRFIFGKLGNLTYLVHNLQKFNGFPFQKDSDQYKKKLAAINKFHVNFLKSLTYLLDLDIKLKKKNDLTKAILDFLMVPKASEKSPNPQLIHLPKRKATKRDYFEKDIEGVDNVKRKKKKLTTKAATDDENENEENSTESKTKLPKSKRKEPSGKATDAHTHNEDDSANTNELKKPAKKRKRNQIITEEDAVEEQKSKKKGKAVDNNKSAINSEEDSKEEELSDDELKEFLKKVLADANLEKTTMKTVYNLISTHYPKYNFNDKKDFIKGVVKSLIQS